MAPSGGASSAALAAGRPRKKSLTDSPTLVRAKRCVEQLGPWTLTLDRKQLSAVGAEERKEVEVVAGVGAQEEENERKS